MEWICRYIHKLGSEDIEKSFRNFLYHSIPQSDEPKAIVIMRTKTGLKLINKLLEMVQQEKGNLSWTKKLRSEIILLLQNTKSSMIFWWFFIGTLRSIHSDFLCSRRSLNLQHRMHFDT
ncbi:hypothetical protein ACOME3_005839 [Neoechinorhynchus agilis]